MTKILAFAGSARRESLNKRLAKAAAAAAEQAGGEVTFVDMRDYEMPLYDGDLEESNGAPENAQRFKELMIAHDGLLIACPEYNSSITPLLKNTIDWVSRPAFGEPMLAAFQGKTAALVSASPGGLGGLRGLVHVRSILGNIGVLVIPTQVAVRSAHEKFDADGELTDDKVREQIAGVARDPMSPISPVAA